MISRINVISLSLRPVIQEGMTSLVKPEEGINFSSRFDNFQNAVEHFTKRNETARLNDTLFIDDASLDKSKVINMLRSIHSAYGAKTIVYTDSIDGIYLNRLWLSNVSGILHNRETPLVDFFKRIKKENKSSRGDSIYGKESERYFDTGKKFIEAIRLVNRGCDCYDELVTSIILGKHIWAKRESSQDNTGKYWNLFEARHGYNTQEKNASINFMDESANFFEVNEILSHLSGREIEILRKLSAGKKNKEIACELFISADTVVKHKINITKKLGLKSANELFIFAIRYKDFLTSK